jgi:transcriptional regulator with XRE-family HTH domain
MSINFNLIGQRIREYRCALRLRQEELAWEAELSVPYLSGIETGAKQASLRTIIRLANALNVTVDYLLFGAMSRDETDKFQELSGVLNGCDETEFCIIMDTVIGTAAALKRSFRERAER